ncbi:MAG: MFS transporter [Desulfarculus sp.]|nr:MFS transporter [Desulfarculus sp.]
MADAPASRPSPAASPAFAPAWLGWSMWGLGALLYLLGFFQRVAPAVLTRELMSDFGLAAASLGHLSALYFYAYVALQIPMGLLADAWGPRRLLSLGALGAGAGSLLFAAAPGLFWAGLGRLTVGASVAVGWVALLKLALHWFPPSRYALASGLALMVGIAGALSAGVPLRLLTDALGWRPVMLVMGLIPLVMAVAIWLWVRDDPGQRGYRSHAHPEVRGPARSGGVWRGLGEVFGQHNIRLLFAAPGGMVGPVFAFSGLWGVPFLQVAYGLSPTLSAGLCSLLMLGWAAGGPVLGGLSDRLGRRKPLYLGGALAASLGWGLVAYCPGLPLWLLAAALALIGFATGGMIIGFAFAKESVPPRLAGTASGVVNMGVMLGPTILQPAIGLVLDALWDGGLQGGVRQYPLAAFQAGFSLIVLWSLLCSLLLALTRETHCAQTRE